MMAHRYDEKVVRSIASEVIHVPSDCGDYSRLDEFTADWLQRNWNSYFDNHKRPDVVLVGGWPFFTSIPFLREKAGAVVFSDHGVVPPEGYPEETQTVLRKLRKLRRRFLKDSSLIVGVSDFIVNTQSRPDSFGQVPLRTVLNGADHLDAPMWSAEELRPASGPDRALEVPPSLKRRGRKEILALGRWEPGCYKNSEAALTVVQSVRAVVPDVVLLILADPKEAEVPPELADFVQPLGFPDDTELVKIMRHADIGISVSLWEGFNLPLAEIQWLDRPCLAFDVGAHPEVVLDPWFVCRDANEMAEKAIALLAGSGPGKKLRAQTMQKFRGKFTWERAVKEYVEIFEDLLHQNRLSCRE